MNKTRPWRSILFSDLGILILLGLLRFVPLFLTNGQTGWHRDELDTLDNAREMAETVAGIYSKLPDEENARTGIQANNYGQAGAINLYGPGYGLPEAISGMNSYWLRGYGDPPPQTLIVLGYNLTHSSGLFKSCRIVGRITNRFDVLNEESEDQPTLLLCREPLFPWPELWQRLRTFG